MIRVVIADDTADIRMLLRVLLETDGSFVIVAEASNGRQALEACAEHRADLLLLDVSMPVMDGIEVLEALPALNLDRMQVVVLSAFGRDRLEARVKALGAAAYVQKGTSVATITAMLRSVMGVHVGGPEAAMPEPDPAPASTGQRANLPR